MLYRMGVQVRCEGCHTVATAAAGCELPTGWGWVSVDKCWEGFEGVRKRGDRYCYARKVCCTDCLLAMRAAYRTLREQRRDPPNVPRE